MVVGVATLQSNDMATVGARHGDCRSEQFCFEDEIADF